MWQDDSRTGQLLPGCRMRMRGAAATLAASLVVALLSPTATSADTSFVWQAGDGWGSYVHNTNTDFEQYFDDWGEGIEFSVIQQEGEGTLRVQPGGGAYLQEAHFALQSLRMNADATYFTDTVVDSYNEETGQGDQFVQFTVSEDTPFQLSGDVDTLSEDGIVRIQLLSGTESILDQTFSDSGPIEIDVVGLLLAGTSYRVEIDAFSQSLACAPGWCETPDENDSSRAFYDVTLAIPEPGTGVLVALGLAASLHRRTARLRRPIRSARGTPRALPGS